MVSKRAKTSGSDKDQQRVHGRTAEEASFPVPPSAREMPHDYALILEELKSRIQEERLRVVLSANAAMVLLYWDIGRVILGRQQREGWGAKVIDRLSADLRQAFPDMRGLSPRNLKYMRAFASAWPEHQIVQEVLAQITWYHNIALLEKLDNAQMRLWYARKAIANGWSHSILAMQIENAAYEREGIGESAGNVLLTPNEKRVAEDRRDCYWLYVVTDCKSKPQLQNPIKDPTRLQWHEVKKVDHYYLSIDAVTQPMQVREREVPYGDREK